MLHKDIAQNRQNQRYPGVSGYESGTVGSTKSQLLVPGIQTCFTYPKTRCCTKILLKIIKIGDIRGFQGTNRVLQVDDSTISYPNTSILFSGGSAITTSLPALF